MDSIDPIVLTYKLMEIQRVAEDSLSKIKDTILIELSAQVRHGMLRHVTGM